MRSPERLGAEVRVHVDMVGDMFMQATSRCSGRRGRTATDWSSAFFHETAASYERRAVMTLTERMAVVEACRMVDEAVANAPEPLTDNFLVEHRMNVVVHGDDLSPDNAELVYGPAVAAGHFVPVPRTSRLSTTEIVRRIRDRTDL